MKKKATKMRKNTIKIYFDEKTKSYKLKQEK